MAIELTSPSSSETSTIVTASSDCRCRILTCYEDLERYSREWQLLWSEDRDRQIFQSFQWVKAWVHAFARGSSLYTPVVFDREQIIGIIPLIIRNRKLSYLGHNASDYNGLISRPEHRERGFPGRATPSFNASERMGSHRSRKHPARSAPTCGGRRLTRLGEAASSDEFTCPVSDSIVRRFETGVGSNTAKGQTTQSIEGFCSLGRRPIQAHRKPSRGSSPFAAIHSAACPATANGGAPQRVLVC